MEALCIALFTFLLSKFIWLIFKNGSIWNSWQPVSASIRPLSSEIAEEREGIYRKQWWKAEKAEAEKRNCMKADQSNLTKKNKKQACESYMAAIYTIVINKQVTKQVVHTQQACEVS